MFRSNNQGLQVEARRLQEKLFQRPLDPLQEAFARISLGMLTKRELRKYVSLAETLCDTESDIPRKELTSFLDELYGRPKKVKELSFPIFERVAIRLILIGVLFLLIKGFTNYNYYSIARFGMLFGALLLFWQECKKRAYWTIGITFVIICAYNPIYKAHFARQQWIILDEKLIILLIAGILIELLVWWFKRNSFQL
jgi:hypothetical protein